MSKNMRRAVFSVLAIATLLIFTQADCLACTCELPFPASAKQQVKKARQQSRAVFSGKVLEINQKPETHFVEVKFKVKSSWKGDLPAEITIVTGRGGGDCGFRFTVGETYLVYAYGSDENTLGTNICQRTAEISGAGEDLKILGRGKDLVNPLKR